MSAFIKYCIMAIAVALVGCSTTPPPVEQLPHYVTIPDRWIAPCAIVPPPDPILYKQVPAHEREKLWANVYTRQVIINKECSVYLDKARKKNAEYKLRNQTNGYLQKSED